LETFFVFYVSIVFLVYICRMIDEAPNILARVKNLYHKYGIRSVTMDDVARELGISKKTLYQHFRDKDDLVNQVVDAEIEYRRQMFGGPQWEQMNAIEQLLELTRCVSDMLKAHSAVTEYDLKKYYPDLYVKVREVRREHIQKFFHANLKKGLDEGLYRPELHADIIIRLSVYIVDGLVDSDVVTIEEFLEHRFLIEFIQYHTRGIATALGLKILEEQLQMRGLV